MSESPATRRRAAARQLAGIAGTMALGLLVLVALPVVAAEQPDAEALKHLVHQDCGSCHGLTLKGGLGPDIRPEAVAHYDSATLAGVILDGIAGTAMPPWRPLMSEAEARWVADYLLEGSRP